MIKGFFYLAFYWFMLELLIYKTLYKIVTHSTNNANKSSNNITYSGTLAYTVIKWLRYLWLWGRSHVDVVLCWCFCRAFAPYTTGLSSTMLIWAAETRCMQMAHLDYRDLYRRVFDLLCHWVILASSNSNRKRLKTYRAIDA